MAKRIKKHANENFLMGEVEEAMVKYGEALEICPLLYRKERVVFYSNRAKCCLLIRNSDAAISDTTRALSLCRPPNCHADSLWTRSKAYDMKRMAKERLMDCVSFINVLCKKSVKIPHYAVRMMSKQAGSVWLFRNARKNRGNAEMMQNKISGLPTISVEPFSSSSTRSN